MWAEGRQCLPGRTLRLQRDPAWHTVSVPCGTDVMVDMPQELTQILIDAV